ncbi:CCHC-type domain-containing protein [Trichonephila clavipes]|nr:CCHC-type domain-containing protein [Trichonephila clavipes]
MGGINMPEDQKIPHLKKGGGYQERQPNVIYIYIPISTVNEEGLSVLIRRIVKEELAKVLPRVVVCINDGSSDLESTIRGEVRSNLTPFTREKPSSSPYRTKRTGESSWRPRPRPRQENRPTQQDTGRKTDLWTRQRRQLDQYESWDSDSVADYGHDPESNCQRYRSNSPYPRRNPQCRQSRSPSRRSPVRTSEEN